MKDKLTADDIVVVAFHDHGTRYIGKIYNDDWMREKGFLDADKTKAIDLVQDHLDKRLMKVAPTDKLSVALELMTKYDISQIPVIDNAKNVGSLDERHIFPDILANQDIKNDDVAKHMKAAFPVVEANTPIEEVSTMITKEIGAVLVKTTNNDDVHIITRHDVIKAVGK